MLHLEHSFVAKGVLFLLNAAWIYDNLFLVDRLMGFGWHSRETVESMCLLVAPCLSLLTCLYVMTGKLRNGFRQCLILGSFTKVCTVAIGVKIGKE